MIFFFKQKKAHLFPFCNRRVNLEEVGLREKLLVDFIANRSTKNYVNSYIIKAKKYAFLEIARKQIFFFLCVTEKKNISLQPPVQTKIRT